MKHKLAHWLGWNYGTMELFKALTGVQRWLPTLNAASAD